MIQNNQLATTMDVTYCPCHNISYSEALTALLPQVQPLETERERKITITQVFNIKNINWALLHELLGLITFNLFKKNNLFDNIALGHKQWIHLFTIFLFEMP